MPHTPKTPIFIICLLLILICSVLFSEQWMSFYETDVGDPIRCPTHIIEDYEHNIWVGTVGYTEEFLFKFDGIHWTHYSDEHGLTYPPVYEFTLDDTGRLWTLLGHPITFTQSVCYFDDSLWHCFNLADYSEHLSFRELFLYDGSFVLAEYSEIYHYDTLTGLSVFDTTNSMRYCSTIYKDQENTLWIENYDEERNRRISRYDPSGRRDFYIDCDQVIFNMFLDSNDTLWVLSEGCGLYCIHDTTIIHHDTSTILIDYDMESFDATEDSEGNIWISEDTRPEGTITIISDTGVEHKTCNSLPLCDCYPHHFYRDSFDNIWISGNDCVTVYNPDTIVFAINEVPSKPENFKLKAYPNPFNSRCNIEKPNNLSADILDIEGNLVDIIQPNESYWKPKEDTPAGKYLIHVDDEDVSYRQSVIYVK